MARVKSIVQLRGRIRDDHFTKRIGEKGVIMSANGGATASQIRTLPQFQLTRENNSEFSALQLFAKTMKNVLIPFLATCTNNYNFMRDVTRQVKKVQLQDTTSLRGQRQILYNLMESFLLNLQFNRKSNLFSSFVGQYTLVLNGGRNSVVFTPLSANNVSQVAPTGATHYKLSVTLFSIADVVWNPLTSNYELSAAVANQTNVKNSDSDWVDITDSGIMVPLTPAFDGSPIMGTNETVFVAVSISFAQVVGGIFNKMASKDAGAILLVG